MDGSLDNSEDAGFPAIWEACQPYTMTSFERGLALYRSVRYLVENEVPGDFVECGVWRGGSVMLMMRTLQELGADPRRIWLFDTFDGMTPPSEVDVDYKGNTASMLLNAREIAREDCHVTAFAAYETVVENVSSVGYPMDLVRFVRGDVSNTIPATQAEIDRLALLRLDTDFYDSTLVELQHLYPKLQQHGVLLIDDYGHWEGARRAVDEYFAARPGVAPFFHWIDYTGRLVVRFDQADTPAAQAESGLE